MTRRIWAVRGVLGLGLAVSVAANILHARANPVSQTIAAWPPVALLLTVELISRVPVLRRSLAVLRIAATSAVAGIAAWVSYWHMAGVAGRYGEGPVSAHLYPILVDGLVVVASVCLAELNATTVVAEPLAVVEAAPAPTAEPLTVVDDVPAVSAEPLTVVEATPTPTAEPLTVTDQPAIIGPASRGDQIRQHLAAHPGVPATRIAKALSVPTSTVKYHRRKLAETPRELVSA